MASKAEFFTSTVAPINMIWVGEPPEKGVAYEGLDVKGPIELAQKLKEQELTNPINFFCRTSELEYYRSAFSNYSNVNVRSLAQALSINLPEEYQKIRQSLRDATQMLENGNIRERVLLKDLLSLYVIWAYGGYFFDTSIYPDPDKTLTLPTYSNFQVPLLDSEKVDTLGRFYNADSGVSVLMSSNNYPILFDFEKTIVDEEDLSVIEEDDLPSEGLDCFVFYAPAQHPSVMTAISVFIKYLQLLGAIDHDTEQYHNATAELALLAVTNGYYDKQNIRSAGWYSPMKDVSAETASRDLPYIGCIKIFTNSHLLKEEEEASFTLDWKM